jgi:adenine deaminase
MELVKRPLMDEAQTRNVLCEVALGNVAVDTVITRGTLFNVFTREFIPDQSIWIKDGRIAYVGPDHDPAKTERTTVIDAHGMVLLPGLIDAHTHISSTKSTVDEFVKHVIPGGTTTVVTETMDLAFIAGEDGLKHWVKGFKNQPIRIYYTVPVLCGLTPSEEINALSTEELLSYLKNPHCLGLGEIYWSNLFLPGPRGDRLFQIASVALDLGKRIEGHTAGASGRKLQGYSCLGVSSCHEPITVNEVLERVRLGYWTMIREGSVRRELDGIRGLFARHIDFRRVILSTDSVDAVDILERGYLEDSLRKMLRLGVQPEVAYQMVTLNAAEHFRLDDQIGSLSPGRMADIVLIPSPGEFSPQLVLCDGKVIYRDGHVLAHPRRVQFPDNLLDTVKVQPFTLPSLPGKGKVRAIQLVTNLVTQESIVDLEESGASKDLLMVLAVNRLGTEGSFLGFIRGFGLKEGALGSTQNWDTGDMVVVGCDPSSMTTVIERLKKIHGGYVYAVSREVVAELATPICGFLSYEPMEFIRDGMRRLEKILQEKGVPWEKPLTTLDTLTTPAIPHIRITHNGYVRLKDRAVLSWDV